MSTYILYYRRAGQDFQRIFIQARNSHHAIALVRDMVAYVEISSWNGGSGNRGSEI